MSRDSVAKLRKLLAQFQDCEHVDHSLMAGYLPAVLDELDLYRSLGPITVAPHWMGPGGPVCGCGAPSTHESGWCGREHLDEELDRLRELARKP